MTIKKLLIEEIESAPDALLRETLNFLRFLKTKQDIEKPEVKSLPTETEAAKTKETSSNSQHYRPASGRSILRHAGTWAGDDFEECLQQVYRTNGKAKFDYNNPFD